MGEYKSWFDRAQAKLNQFPIKLRESRNDEDGGDDAESVNSLLNFRESMDHFPPLRGGSAATAVTTTSVTTTAAPAAPAPAREATVDQKVDNVLAIAEELVQTTRDGKLPSMIYPKSTTTPLKIPETGAPKESVARHRSSFTSDHSHASSLSSRPSIPRAPAGVAAPSSSHRNAHRPSSSSQFIRNEDDDNNSSNNNNTEATPSSSSVRGKSGLKLPSLVHQAKGTPRISGSSSVPGYRQQTRLRTQAAIPRTLDTDGQMVRRARWFESPSSSDSPVLNTVSTGFSKASTQAVSNMRTDSQQRQSQYEVHSIDGRREGEDRTSGPSQGVDLPPRNKMPMHSSVAEQDDDDHNDVEVLDTYSGYEVLPNNYSNETNIRLPPTPPRTPTMDMDRLNLSPSQLAQQLRRPSPRRTRRLQEEAVLQPPHWLQRNEQRLQRGHQPDFPPILSPSSSWSYPQRQEGSRRSRITGTSTLHRPPSGHPIGSEGIQFNSCA